MVTKKMMNYIIEYSKKEQPTDNKSKIKHCVYMNRLQKSIDKDIKDMNFLATHFTKLFIDEDREHKDSNGKVIKNRRLKWLMFTIKSMNPKMDVILVLNNMPEENISSIKT